MKFRIIILSIFIYSIAAVTENDFSSVKLLELGSKLIYISPGLKTSWHGAMEYCATLGLRLLTINSAQENLLLTNLIKNYTPSIGTTWTSGNDISKEGEWVWSSTGKKFQYSGWTKYPDNELRIGECESENCLEVGNDFGTFRVLDHLFWNDARCLMKRLFICEQPR